MIPRGGRPARAHLASSRERLYSACGRDSSHDRYMSFEAMHQSHHHAKLDEETLDRDPIRQFRRWMEDAVRAELPEPTAAALATAGGDGRPSIRMVLLKEYEQDGFVFYTNYESRKARELEENPHAALACFWPELERQVTICGRVSRVLPAESDAYFRTRPRDSQLGAWASHQSQTIESREVLVERFRALEAEHRDRDIPRPSHWGGYRLTPETIEFWQGRRSRLHDRFEFRRGSDGGWRIRRLSP